MDDEFKEILNFIRNEFFVKDKYQLLDIDKLKNICAKIKENEIIDTFDVCENIIKEK